MSSTEYTIYIKPHDRICEMALDEFYSKDIPVNIYDISSNPEANKYILEAGFTTLPQIFKDSNTSREHIGGYIQLCNHFANIESIPK